MSLYHLIGDAVLLVQRVTLELAEVGTELGEDARTREADLTPEEDGPRLLAFQPDLDIVGHVVVEVFEHGVPELGQGLVDVVNQFAVADTHPTLSSSK